MAYDCFGLCRESGRLWTCFGFVFSAQRPTDESHLWHIRKERPRNGRLGGKTGNFWKESTSPEVQRHSLSPATRCPFHWCSMSSTVKERSHLSYLIWYIKLSFCWNTISGFLECGCILALKREKSNTKGKERWRSKDLAWVDPVFYSASLDIWHISDASW